MIYFAWATLYLIVGIVTTAVLDATDGTYRLHSEALVIGVVLWPVVVPLVVIVRSVRWLSGAIRGWLG